MKPKPSVQMTDLKESDKSTAGGVEILRESRDEIRCDILKWSSIVQ